MIALTTKIIIMKVTIQLITEILKYLQKSNRSPIWILIHLISFLAYYCLLNLVSPEFMTLYKQLSHSILITSFAYLSSYITVWGLSKVMIRKIPSFEVTSLILLVIPIYCLTLGIFKGYHINLYLAICIVAPVLGVITISIITWSKYENMIGKIINIFQQNNETTL